MAVAVWAKVAVDADKRRRRRNFFMVLFFLARGKIKNGASEGVLSSQRHKAAKVITGNALCDLVCLMWLTNNPCFWHASHLQSLMNK